MEWRAPDHVWSTDEIADDDLLHLHHGHAHRALLGAARLIGRDEHDQRIAVLAHHAALFGQIEGSHWLAPLSTAYCVLRKT